MSDPVVNIIVLPATGTSAFGVDVKIQLLPNTSGGAGTSTVSVLSPTDNSEQNTKALYSAGWAKGSEQAGSVDDETTYTTCTATFTDATTAGVTLNTTNYQLVVFGKSGKAYTSANYKTLTLNGANTATIRFEYPKNKRPDYVDDILDGNISAYAK